MSGAITTVEEFSRAEGCDPRAVVDFFADHERARLVATKTALHEQVNLPPLERLPLTDADGYEFGRVAASIPEDLFYHLMDRPDLDPHWTESPDGVREVVKDVLKSNPGCRVKTVSGKTVVGWEPPYRGNKMDPPAGRRQHVGRRAVNFSGANFNGLEPADR
jgi:hypothetical protein